MRSSGARVRGRECQKKSLRRQLSMSAALISRVSLAIFGPHDRDFQPEHAPTDSPADAASGLSPKSPDSPRGNQPQLVSANQLGTGPRQPGGPGLPFIRRYDSSKPPNRTALSSSFPNHPPSSSPVSVAPSPSSSNLPVADANQLGQRQPGGPKEAGHANLLGRF